jgi:hypothetical protein
MVERHIDHTRMYHRDTGNMRARCSGESLDQRGMYINECRAALIYNALCAICQGRSANTTQCKLMTWRLTMVNLRVVIKVVISVVWGVFEIV